MMHVTDYLSTVSIEYIFCGTVRRLEQVIPQGMECAYVL